MKIEAYNVILITLDSLALRSAQLAKSLYLNSLSKLHEAETHATYTFPAHYSFFLGILPRITNTKSLYLNKYKQIWRSSLSRKSDNVIAISFEDKSIMDYYRKLGHSIVGFGGVTFFDTTSKCNTLPKFFDEFTFFGPYQKTADRPYPRDISNFPLNNIKTIVSKIPSDPFFVFINSIATHVPYDNPESRISDLDKLLMERLFKEHSSKVIHSDSDLPFTQEEHDMLIDKQVKSLIWADQRIKELLSSIPRTRPTILIVCGDHGEEFGQGGRYGHAHAHASVMHVPYWDCILPPNR